MAQQRKRAGSGSTGSQSPAGKRTRAKRGSKSGGATRARSANSNQTMPGSSSIPAKMRNNLTKAHTAIGEVLADLPPTATRSRRSPSSPASA